MTVALALTVTLVLLRLDAQPSPAAGADAARLESRSDEVAPVIAAPAQSADRASKDPRPLPGAAALEEHASLMRGRKTLRHRAEVRRHRAELRQQRAEAQRRQKAHERKLWKAEHAPFTVRIGSFNVLGSQHSTPSGDHPGFPRASVRTGRAAGYISRHGVDILGAQELQADQLRQITSITGLAAYPGFGWGEKETDNSILYDSGVYEFVSGDTYHITFVHRTRPQPILRLRDRATGREFYVLNTHTSPGGGSSAGERYRAHATTSALVGKLRATGLPVLLTGDMNDRQEFYCKVVATASMSAPQGGSYGAGCQPPAGHLAVDWVVGAGIDRWSDYWMDTSSVANKTSDHFFVSATAHVED